MSKLLTYLRSLLGQYAKNSDLASYVKGNDASYFLNNVEYDYDRVQYVTTPASNTELVSPVSGYVCIFGKKATSSTVGWFWLASRHNNYGSYSCAYGDSGQVGCGALPVTKGTNVRIRFDSASFDGDVTLVYVPFKQSR